MEERGPWGAESLPQVDSGLDYLLPLYQFLHSTCMDAICCLLVRRFKDTHYVQENIGKCIKSEMKLSNFLEHINQAFRDVKDGDKCSKKRRCKKPSSSPSQAYCSQQQQQQCRLIGQQQTQHCHSLQHWSVGQQLQPAQLNQYTSHLQQTSQDQHLTQSMENLQTRRPADVKNIAENRVILEKLCVGDLLRGSDDVCQMLCKLDLNFILNVALNRHVNFVKDKECELLKAIFKIKDIRKALVHANYDFNECDFEDNLKKLEGAMAVVHKELLLPEAVLQQRVDLCRNEAKSGSKVSLILSHLVSEAHSKYSSPSSTFVPPHITSSQMHDKKVIEDLDKFIENQQDHQDPILLCGEQRQEKSRLLEKLAFTFIATTGPLSRFKLVLHLNESHRRNYYHPGPWARNTRYNALGFQDQVFACLTNLVPDTVHQHSLDSVKAVIKRYQKYILFLINWNINMLDSVRREIRWGTWIITYEGKDLSLVDWQVLRMKPYTEAQVEKMLCSYPNKNDLLNCYYSFDKKDILSSLDMIQIFCEVCGTVSTGTDFEVVEKYVLRTLECTGIEEHVREQDMLRLGEVAFTSLCKGRLLCKDVDVWDVQHCVRDSFLYCNEEKEWSFKHLVVRDFLAAKYVFSKSSIACEKWMKENIAVFKRVFKFVCFMWFESPSVSEYLPYMETFLRKLLHVPDKKKRTEYSEKEARSGNRNSNRRKKREKKDSKHKNPFDSWGFLLELDEACDGKRKVLQRIASVLSDIPCWRFNASEFLDTGRLTRLEKVLKKVALDERDPLIIKLKSNTSVTVVTELWKKLKCIEALYGCANLMVTIEGDDGAYLRDGSKIENFLKMVTDTQVPLYITRYKGPVFSSSIPNILKCVCMRHIEILEVSVFDVASLREVVTCRALPVLREVFIRVNLKLSEQTNFTPAIIEFPPEVLMNIIIGYFPKVQQLFNSFKNCHHLYSLSIHGMYIKTDFKLDLSAFSQLESLNIRFEPESQEEDMMEVERKLEHCRGRLPRYNWLFHLWVHLTLPQNLKRLLLRNVDFFSDSNQNLIEKFFRKYSINRLLMLDTQLSLAGAGKILCSQTEDEEDQSPGGGGKRLRKMESLDMKKLASKRMRLSMEEREARKWNRPDGKEVVITSDGQICSDCSCFPCMCPLKLNRDEGCNSYKRMAELINDMYCRNVQGFSYSFNQCTIRKDICGDLRVECIMRRLNDTVILEIDSRSYLSDFFLPLMLAQSVTLKETDLSPVGVAKVAEHLMHIKNTNKVEPFSLTIETRWHPSGNASPFQGFKGFLKTAEYLTVLHYRCGCAQKCFYIRKTYKGKILDMVHESG